MKSFLTTLLLVTLTFNIISLTYARNLQSNSEADGEEEYNDENSVTPVDDASGEGEEQEQEEEEDGEQDKGTQPSTPTKTSTDGYQIAAFIVVMIPLALISSI